MRNVYVVTHPEATHHVEGVVGGWHDSQLTAGGVHAAASIAEELRARIPNDATVELSRPTFSVRRKRRESWETVST